MTPDSASTLAVVATALVLLAALVGAAVWLATRRRGQREAAAERAVLEERLRGREGRILDLREELERTQGEVTALRDDNLRLSSRLAEQAARRDAERRAAEEKLDLLDAARGRLEATFKALSGDVLERNSAAFLDLARRELERLQEVAQGDLDRRQRVLGELVRPVSEALEKVDRKLEEAERSRRETHGGLSRHLQDLAAAHGRLQRETAQLAQALRSPTVRGRWGEVQLERAVEMAGLVEGSDFLRQPTLTGGDGGTQRPDLVVQLPGGRTLAVDAKAPLEGFLAALDATDDDTRRRHRDAHAAALRRHVEQLASREYWRRLPGSPELVVLFLPGEAVLGAALEADAALLDFGTERGVLLASPVTLIALLKAVAHGWRQEQLAGHAREIRDTGRLLLERLRTFLGHLDDLRRGLDRAVAGYNRAVGSLQGRVLPAARRLQELGAGDREAVADAELVERLPRPLAEEPGD